jgi:hypothetical protein
MTQRDVPVTASLMLMDRKHFLWRQSFGDVIVHPFSQVHLMKTGAISQLNTSLHLNYLQNCTSLLTCKRMTFIVNKWNMKKLMSLRFMIVVVRVRLSLSTIWRHVHRSIQNIPDWRNKIDGGNSLENLDRRSRASRWMAPLIHNLSATCRWKVSFTPWPITPRNTRRYPLHMRLSEPREPVRTFREEKNLFQLPASENRIAHPVT